MTDCLYLHVFQITNANLYKVFVQQYSHWKIWLKNPKRLYFQQVNDLHILYNLNTWKQWNCPLFKLEFRVKTKTINKLKSLYLYNTSTVHALIYLQFIVQSDVINLIHIHVHASNYLNKRIISIISNAIGQQWSTLSVFTNKIH